MCICGCVQWSLHDHTHISITGYLYVWVVSSFIYIYIRVMKRGIGHRRLHDVLSASDSHKDHICIWSTTWLWFPIGKGQEGTKEGEGMCMYVCVCMYIIYLYIYIHTSIHRPSWLQYIDIYTKSEIGVFVCVCVLLPTCRRTPQSRNLDILYILISCFYQMRISIHFHRVYVYVYIYYVCILIYTYDI